MRSKPLPRSHELTAVVNREIFDEPPGDITDPADLERWRQFRQNYHRAQALERFDFPLQLDFELNSTCTMRCGFCLHGFKKVEKKLLGRERFERAINEGERHGLCSIKLNYINEPLLVPELPDYIRYAKTHGVLNIYFATNGQLLTERAGRALIEARTSKVMISIDAATSATYEKMRKNKMFDRIVGNIENFLELRDRMGTSWPLVRVNFLKTSQNIHELDQFVDHWKDKVDSIGVQDCNSMPGEDFDSETMALRAAKLKDFKCSFPFKMMVIDSAGQILPCCTMNGREMPMGHIDDVTIEEAWKTANMRSLQEEQIRGELNDICLHCIGAK